MVRKKVRSKFLLLKKIHGKEKSKNSILKGKEKGKNSILTLEKKTNKNKKQKTKQKSRCK